MPALALGPNHKAVVNYYESLAAFAELGEEHEQAVRLAFATLLEIAARPFGWKLVPEHSLRIKSGRRITPDGTLMDLFRLQHGHWEAKDSRDDLDKEIRLKISNGYPMDNLLFWEPRRAVLYQHGTRVADVQLNEPSALLAVLAQFLEFAPQAIAQWEAAVLEFKDKVPALGMALASILKKSHKENRNYAAAFQAFVNVCRSSLNPNLSEAAVEEMLVQHLLTERILRKIFAIENFRERNVIAADIERVVGTLTARHFRRDDFLKALDPFYRAIETAAETITDFSEKQKFLNTVYERFFQGFAVKQADVLGVVYTPQPLVRYMIAGVVRVLREHFNTSLGAKGVHIFDPFTGTGNFIVNIMQPEHIPGSALKRKYAEELHCNEVSLLPYYVASMNIEHAHFERTEQYEAFEGICLVDTFETIEKEQGELDIFNEANSERVKRQRATKDIRVIIANPPYNAGQVNENDNNKNRRYEVIDEKVKNTYAADSTATLRRKLWDPYVKAIRFATDRIGAMGVICYVNNNSFVRDITFDGMRKHLESDFDLIYVLDLGGNIRKGETGSGNVFGIKVGVSINLFVRLPPSDASDRKAKILYYETPDNWSRGRKMEFLDECKDGSTIAWRKLTPDAQHNWFPDESAKEFRQFIPIGGKDKAQDFIFRTYSLGVSTNRDSVVYDFDAKCLNERVERFADDYNAELERWRRKARPPKNPKLLTKYVDDFVDYDRLKWSRNLKRWFRRGIELKFDSDDVTLALYRPFTRKHLHFSRMFVDEIGTIGQAFPRGENRSENRAIVVPGSGNRFPFGCFMTDRPVALDFAFEKAQCFPLYVFGENARDRIENIGSGAIEQFRKQLDADEITAEEIFYYVYGVLHDPRYRERFAENLKRELPRIPICNSREVFYALSVAGHKLADLHVNFESVKPYKLTAVENPTVPPNWRVEAMKLSKDERTLVYNEWLELRGIPPEASEYRLGSRSALAWIVNQYRVERDASGEVVSDPNKPGNENAIVQLIGQVVAVSVDSMRIVRALPSEL